LTADIVADIVTRCAYRNVVMIFASTVQHAEEVIESLPKEISRIVTAETKDRKEILNEARQGKIKYIVSVGALTTGVDIPRCDAVAVLRAMESVGLMQQIAGRGARLCPEIGKTDFLFLDYAENIERHCPDGDLFNPEIKASYHSDEKVLIKAKCPDCGVTNEFAARKNDEGFEVTEEGYFCDLTGELIMIDDKPMPAHYGRRCYGQTIKRGVSERCEYRWSSKDCDDCGHHNDIAARYCESCKSELIDPNEKLVIEYKKLKKDPYSLTTDKVLAWSSREHMSKAGNLTLRVDYTTEYRTFSVWYMKKKKTLWIDLCLAVYGKPCPDVKTFLKYVNSHGRMPETITVRREQGSKFYTVYGHNKEEDNIDEVI
jgi:DNA repair protein RadD